MSLGTGDFRPYPEMDEYVTKLIDELPQYFEYLNEFEGSGWHILSDDLQKMIDEYSNIVAHFSERLSPGQFVLIWRTVAVAESLKHLVDAHANKQTSKDWDFGVGYEWSMEKMSEYVAEVLRNNMKLLQDRTQ